MESKKASKQYDLTQGKYFLDGKIDIDGSLQQKIIATFQEISGLDMSVLSRNEDHGTPVYLFLRVVQRGVRDECSLHTARLVMHQGQTQRTSIQLSPHKDGEVLKASLRPNSEGA